MPGTRAESATGRSANAAFDSELLSTSSITRARRVPAWTTRSSSSRPSGRISSAYSFEKTSTKPLIARRGARRSWDMLYENVTNTTKDQHKTTDQTTTNHTNTTE